MARRRKRARAVEPARGEAMSGRTAPTRIVKDDDTTDDNTVEDKPDTDKTSEEDLDDIHKTALEEYQRGFDKDRKNQERAYEDLRFLAEEGQWEPIARQERLAEGRPILTANKCPQFVRQVTGDIRQSRPAIKVVPVDDSASQEVAEQILPGMIRYIEQRSDAQGVYFATADSTCACGVGHWRVTTEYASQSTFNQEIRISPIEDGVAVVWDPDAILMEREDAMFCFVPVDMARKAFEKKFPDASSDPLPHVPAFFQSWFTDDYVRVCEYWCKKPIKRKIAVYPDGDIQDITNADEATLVDVHAYQGVKIEERDGFQVLRYLMSATEIIDGPEEWPGVHIPIIPFLGEETKFGREIYRHGVVRPLMDVQRAHNYAFSTQTEVIALQPKAPFLGTRVNFEKYQDQWETSNSKNWPYLEYEPDPRNGGQKPDRSSPPIASSGLSELLQTTTADMSAVTGIYPSSLGQQSNESSGKAILARQREGDTGTYVYIENFGRAVRRTGQIVVDLIPHVYDSERTIHIAGEDGKIDRMEVNKEELDPNGDGIATRTLNDLTIGAYEVSIEMGPSYNTRREEARDGMQAMIQALGPQGATLFIDLFAKQQDWPLADKIAKRAHLMLPPPIQAAEAQESGEPPPPQMPPPPPTPEQQAQAQEMQFKQAEHEDQKQQKQAEFALQGQQHQLERDRLAFDQHKFDAELQRDLEVARMGHAATMAGHDATVKSAQAAQPDQRIDALADAVEQLRQAVLEIADAIGLGSQEAAPAPAGPPPPPNGGMPPINPPPSPPPPAAPPVMGGPGVSFQ